MKSNYNQLGQYIEMVSRTNSDLKYGIEDVRGCSNTKQMMQTRANLIGRTYEKFIVLRPQEFVFNRRTTRNGEKIGMAYNNTDREYIFTNDYVAFRVKQEYLDELLPDYLYMFFCRDEFDRYARYKSTGSATEFFNWEDMCAVPFEIPPMDFQQLVVNAYKVLNERIETKQKINDNLDATIYAKFQDMFQKNKEILFSGEQLEDWCIKPLSFLADFKYGKMATSEILCKKGFPVYSGYRTVGYCNKYMFKEPQLVVLARGVSGTGEVRISPPCCHLTNLSIAVLLYDRTYINYLLYYLENDNLISLDSGSAQSQITINDLSMHKVMLPPYSKVVEFDNIAKQLRSIIDENNKEIEVLEELKKVLLTTISSR